MSIASLGWRREPTITSPSPVPPASWWLASAPFCVAAPPEKVDSSDGEYQLGALQLSTRKRQAFWQEQLLDLTSTEFSLLAALCQHVGQVLSKNQLSEQILGRPLTRYDRSLDNAYPANLHWRQT